MTDGIGPTNDYSVGPHFVSNFASINALPYVTSVANMGFDVFAMFWFGFLSTIMDAKLKDFADKMNFVADIQQSLSEVSTTFQTIKTWESFKTDNMTEADVSTLGKAFYSLVRFREVLKQSYLKVGGNPFGKTIFYTTHPVTGVGRWLVTASGTKVDPPKPVPNPMKDTSLANKITQLIEDLGNSNTSQISTNGYTGVTAYNGNLVSYFLSSDPMFATFKTSMNSAEITSASSAYAVTWSNFSGKPTNYTDVISHPIKGLSTQYLSFANSRDKFATPVSSSILSDAATDASTGVTAAQSLSGTTQIKLDQFEQIQNMYNNIRSQIQQSIAQRNLLVIKNSGGGG